MAQLVPKALDAALEFGGIAVPAFFVCELSAHRKLPNSGANVVDTGGFSHVFHELPFRS
ncbi:hypothetical protein [Mycobacterium colombiense]|uniref:hypothetical protein n=1 Tax=Mycobacterium colombiense TaxID=339268 RepID=UPI0018C87E75|nr:hypothetical protein [Mycobacterium colombiense]